MDCAACAKHKFPRAELIFLNSVNRANLYSYWIRNKTESLAYLRYFHYDPIQQCTVLPLDPFCNVYKSRAIAGRTARCCCMGCKFRYVSKFTAASRGFSATARLSCTGLHQPPFKCWNYTKYADFHGVIVTLVLSCTVSMILQVLLCSWPHPYSTLIWGCSRCTRSPMLGSARA